MKIFRFQSRLGLSLFFYFSLFLFSLPSDVHAFHFDVRRLRTFMIRHDASRPVLETKKRPVSRGHGATHNGVRLVVSRTMDGLRADSMDRFLRVNRDLHRNRVITRFSSFNGVRSRCLSGFNDIHRGCGCGEPLSGKS